MVSQPLWQELLKLSNKERAELANRLWDTIPSTDEYSDLTDRQKAEVDRRLKRMRSDPGQGIEWSVAREQIKRKP